MRLLRPKNDVDRPPEDLLLEQDHVSEKREFPIGEVIVGALVLVGIFVFLWVTQST